MKRTIDIKLGESEYTVKADFATIERIEERFDMMTFLRSMQSYKTKTRDVAWVLYCAIINAGYELKYADIGQSVLDDFENATTGAAEIVASALGAGPEKKSKKKSQAATPDGLESENITE